MTGSADLSHVFRRAVPSVDRATLRFVRNYSERVVVRRGLLQPSPVSDDVGVMVSVQSGGGTGYAATPDLSETGLREAFRRAQGWAERTADCHLLREQSIPPCTVRGEYRTPVVTPWSEVSLGDKVTLLRELCEKLDVDSRIVDSIARLWHAHIETRLLTTDGGDVEQHRSVMIPQLSATAHGNGVTQTRTFGSEGYGRQGGYEVLDQVGFVAAAPNVAAQALELLDAPNCPSGVRDLLLDPDQMLLQIHESIGHPLELDRILGDERNYAGTTFVTQDMFGNYQYGSSLLNVTFDPTRPEQLASYGFDDEGLPARKVAIIENGILQRPLGGQVSQSRTGMEGVANARASSWNRPPIDRMANLNLEPGDSSFEEMVASVERGIYLETNCSWSIDDSRNKFQFGCERGQLIEDGRLTTVVRNPNYRGVSRTFWRNLKAVGNPSTYRVMGSPYCGKGEPNQLVFVGHASPACLFGDVDVFGANQ